MKFFGRCLLIHGTGFVYVNRQTLIAWRACMRSNKGFSLLELLVAIVIFGVLATIATPNAISWLRTAQFHSAVREVKSTIDGMRMFNVENNAQSDITFVGNNRFQTDKLERTTNTHDIHWHSVDETVDVSFNNNPLRYNARGMAVNPGTLIFQGPSGLCMQMVVSVAGTSNVQQCP